MSVEVLLDQALHEGRFSASDVGESDERSLATLLARLVGLQNVDLPPWEALEQAVRRPGELSMSQQQANLLYFCDQVFEQSQSQTDVEPELLEAFMVLRPVVASVLLRNPAILHSLNHPLFSLLDQLWDAGRYWSADLGKPGDKYRSRLDEMLARVRKADPVNAPFQEWLDELTGQLAKDAQRAETLTDRIRQTAKGALAGVQAERIIRLKLDDLLLRADMPEEVEELLKGPLRDSMRVLYLSKGEDSDEWKQILRVGDLLVDSMQSPDSDEARQKGYQIIPKVIPMLTKQLVSISDAVVMDSWIQRIEKLHMQILLGNSVALRAAQPLSALENAAGISTNVSSALLDQVKMIPEGQWLVYQRDDGEKLRCRLVLKTEDAGLLLFVNVLGAKCMEKTLEEFAYLLAARHIRLLDSENNFSQILRDTIANFLQLYQRQSLLMTEAAERKRIEMERRRLAQQKARREAEQIAQKRLEAQARAEDEARQQLELQARIAQEKAQKAAEEAKWAAEEAQKAAEQAKQYARAKASQNAAAEAERIKQEAAAELDRQILAEKQARINEWESAQQSVRSLGVGAWVDLEIQGERQRCKLAAVLNASDKLIFVGRDGKKLLEPRRDELIKMLLDNKARIVQQGDQFENSLAKVIQTLRKD